MSGTRPQAGTTDLKRWYRALVEDSPTGMVAAALDGRVLFANRMVYDLTGHPRRPADRCVWDYVAPHDGGKVRALFAAVRGGALERFETALLRADGTTFTVGVTMFPVRRGERTIGVGMRVHDLTTLWEAERRRLENLQSERLRALYVVATSAGRTPDQQIQATLELGNRLLGGTTALLSEIAGDEIVVRFSMPAGFQRERGFTRKLSETFLRHAIDRRDVLAIEDLYGPPWDADPARGDVPWTAYIGTPIERFGKLYGWLMFGLTSPGGRHFGDSDKDLVRLMGALCGSTLERLAHEERLGTLAFYDALTGLPNRVLFDDRVAQTLVAARRHNQKFALLYFDLDDFKDVNDVYGHAAGDELLRVVASRLKAIARESDTIARQGGDEFVLLQRFVRSPGDAMRLARRINEALRQPVRVGEAVVTVSTSIGVALYPTDGTTCAELLAHADAALYRAKQTGRDRAVLYKLAGSAH